MISFLVTYYNQENYVSRSLNSILSQNLTEPFEILIGDDGSQDNTVGIINTYIKNNPNKIKLFIQERDLSKKYNTVERASLNRLNLLNKANGEYILFLDGDDAYCNFDFVQKSVDFLNKEKKYVGVTHLYQEIYSDGAIIGPKGITTYSTVYGKHYSKNLYTHVGSIIFRNSFNKTDYDKLICLKSFDDNDITFYFLNFGKLHCSQDLVYSYFQNEGSIWNTANNFEKALINAIDYEIIKKIYNHNHIFLLFKYSNSILYLTKNRNYLTLANFEKYKEQMSPNGIVYNLCTYNNLTLFKKIRFSIILMFIEIIIYFFKIFKKVLK